MDGVTIRLAKAACVMVWLLVIVLPLTVLAIEALSSSPQPDMVRPVLASLVRTCLLAGLIAAVAVVLGWLPAKLLGTSGAHGGLLLLLLLMPLVLPQYVLYYAWTLLLSPTTQLGQALASRPELARLVGTVTSTGVLIGWYWPLAALVLAQGWRSIDGRVWEAAALDASGRQVFRHLTLGLLSRPILLAFGICFVLSLSEFATFHLAGVRTIGTELAVLYELTGAAAPVARAAWPVTLIALVAAVALTQASHQWTPTTVGKVGLAPPHTRWWAWSTLVFLLATSWLAPVILLAGNVTTWQPLRQFLTLHADDLAWSLLTAGVAAIFAYLMAVSGLFYWDARNSVRRVLSLVIHGTIFVAMFLPASLLAVSLLKLLALSGLSGGLRQSWLLVSAGQASRFAGLALILLLLTRYPDRRLLTEMAALDGASPFHIWRHVHLARTWPVLAGTFLLVTMFSFTELAATMILLPAGLPSFAQRLLNQMHYARDQQVIASCLVLILLFLVLAGAAVILLRIASARRLMPVLVLLLVIAGCGRNEKTGEPKVIDAFGKTGAGPGEFLYPRAIDLDGDGSVLVADKTGRIQRLSPDGQCLGTIQMPLIEVGKPTGMSLHPDGRLFVADTHYHRVAIFARDGRLVGQFGKYGQEPGCFIFPTDVAFAPDGRVFVSEYGGNDRVSVFTSEGGFLFSFGSPGAAQGQFARPAALCLDPTRECLYVADACNHRIGVYDLNGRLLSYIGAVGRGPGQLRYPYGLSLLADGTIVVCEYGNNRVQLFSPQGKSLAIYGQAGRQLGQLAYPWAVAVDARRRAFVVDAGNNRIQVWQL
jgi:ABC-type Fe3+ transport system permease subunit/DNA-binding beta-propeller fold protein YncE